jgi:hypothetical protein
MSSSFQPGANLYTAAFGARPENVEVPHIDSRAPASTDVLYPIGKRWINTVSNISYTLTSFSSALGVVSANWTVEGGSSNVVSIAGTANQITVANVGGAVTLSTPSSFVAPGSITGTLGAITATNGNLVLSTAGNKLSIATGANASIGSAVLVGGTVTVSTTAVTASSKIFLTVGALGTVAVAKAVHAGPIVAATSFVITSADATDTSTVNWLIIN